MFSTLRQGWQGISYLTLLFCALHSSTVFAGSWQNNLSIGGFNRVHLYTPDSASAIGNGKALLLVLHGCTQSIDAYLNANLASAAEEYGMVIAVPDAVNKAGFGCWSYWQGAKSRTAGDYRNLITLAKNLASDTNLGIDSDQVYIAGLSSGAAFAHTTACLAPDVFAGVGVSAGPSIGTSASGAIGACERANVAARCAQYAGNFASHFNTQIASLAHGDNDTTVNLCYNQQNADGMAELYGVTALPGSNRLAEGPVNQAREIRWQDTRVTMLWFENLDHSWSGGAGANGAFINGSSINYARYLGAYFAQNNRRVSRNTGPVIVALERRVVADEIRITGQGQDAEGSVVEVSGVFTLSPDSSQTSPVVRTVGVDSVGNFALSSGPLPHGLYEVTIVASDDQNLQGEAQRLQVRVGPAPPETPPQLSDLMVTTEGQCATVSGKVIDINLNLDRVSVAFATGQQVATLEASMFNAKLCDQPGGSNSAVVTATDLTGLSSTESVTFEIDAGQIATLDEHISAGRLDFSNYANCYLEYSVNDFKLNEVTLAGSTDPATACQWQDDDNSCRGPVQACSPGQDGNGDDGGDGGDNTETCVEYISSNYSHKLAQRAYSTGNPFLPDYFASGTNSPLPGSTWGINSLHAFDNSNWILGRCP